MIFKRLKELNLVAAVFVLKRKNQIMRTNITLLVHGCKKSKELITHMFFN